MSAINAKASRKTKKYAVLTREPRCFLGSLAFSWEQRKFGEVFMSLQNNTLSRAELNDEFGAAQNIHYGDVLIKYDEILDVSKEPLSYIEKQSIADKFKTSYLQNGDVIIADTAEDETVGKCTEIEGLTDQKVISGLHTMPVRPNRKFASGFLGFYLNSTAYHDQLKPLMQGIKVTSISKGAMRDTVVKFPLDLKEQEQIGIYFGGLDHLITLHQRKPFLMKWRTSDANRNQTNRLVL
jgi:type I restriction enzyme S subunit